MVPSATAKYIGFKLQNIKVKQRVRNIRNFCDNLYVSVNIIILMINYSQD